MPPAREAATGVHRSIGTLARIRNHRARTPASGTRSPLPRLGTPGDEAEFVALADGRLLLDARPDGFDPHRLRLRSTALEFPYRALALRRPEMWAVGIHIGLCIDRSRAAPTRAHQDGATLSLLIDGMPPIRRTPVSRGGLPRCGRMARTPRRFATGRRRVRDLRAGALTGAIRRRPRRHGSDLRPKHRPNLWDVRSSLQTSRLRTVKSLIELIATTLAVLRPLASTAISPNTSPGPNVRITSPFWTTSAFPDVIANIA